MVCHIDDSILIRNSLVVDFKLVSVGKSVNNCYVNITGEAFSAVGAMICELNSVIVNDDSFPYCA